MPRKKKSPPSPPAPPAILSPYTPEFQRLLVNMTTTRLARVPPQPMIINYQGDGPVSRVVAPPEPCTVLWRHGERSYSYQGGKPVVVSPEKENALKAFLAYKKSLDTHALKSAGLSNVSRVMKALAEDFPGAVRLPRRGHKGEGYHIDVRLAPPPKPVSMK